MKMGFQTACDCRHRRVLEAHRNTVWKARHVQTCAQKPGPQHQGEHMPRSKSDDTLVDCTLFLWFNNYTLYVLLALGESRRDTSPNHTHLRKGSVDNFLFFADLDCCCCALVRYISRNNFGCTTNLDDGRSADQVAQKDFTHVVVTLSVGA